MRSTRRITAVLVATSVAVLAIPGPAYALDAGKYSGTTSERGKVTFTVSKGKVIDFSAKDGYNAACHYHGGAGGLVTYTVNVPKMTVSKLGSFTATVNEKESISVFDAKARVTGRLSGTKASGTITIIGRVCGTDSSHPKAQVYLETFSAKRSH